MAAMGRAFRALFIFFKDGFASMTIGKTLWIIVLIKLFIMFGILKIFFFPNQLNRDYDNEDDRADHVRTELIERAVK